MQSSSCSLPLHSIVDGKEVSKVKLPLLDSYNDLKTNKLFLSHYFTKSKACAMNKHPYAKTKKLGEINTTTAKPFKQKGTGKARRGTLCAAHHRGGAKAFGPNGVKASIKINKKESALAKRMLLSEHLNSNSISCIDELTPRTISTKSMISVLSKIVGKDLSTIKDHKILIIHDNTASDVFLKSVRNLFYVQVVSCDRVAAIDFMGKKSVICLQSALKKLLSL